MTVSTHPASAYPWFAAVSDRDLRVIEEDIPEILELRDPDIRHKVALVYASFLKESTYKRVSEVPFVGYPPAKYDLARHSRHVAQLAIGMVRSLMDVWGIEVRHDIVVGAAILHDADVLLRETKTENGKKKTEIGKTFLHAQLCGVRCYEAGLPNDIASMVTRHPFTPPHIHVTPPNVESVILDYSDIGGAGQIDYREGNPTHLSIKKRFFSLDA
jgi:hypothetical protein